MAYKALSEPDKSSAALAERIRTVGETLKWTWIKHWKIPKLAEKIERLARWIGYGI